MNETSTWNENEIRRIAEGHTGEPDNVLSLDIMAVKNLQIGYHAETIFLKAAEDDTFLLKEYIGNPNYEYLAKVSANRFKTTIRYGRREEVNRNSFVEIFLPKSWHGELSLSSQYGHILTEEDWRFERFAAETKDENVILQTIEAPRIRIASAAGSIRAAHLIGFSELHTMTGRILLADADGGAKLESSSGAVYAHFSSLNNLVECNTLNGDIELCLPEGNGMKVDGVSKTGDISCEIEELTVKTRPGNVRCVSGQTGTKPFQNVRISTINANVSLHH